MSTKLEPHDRQPEIYGDANLSAQASSTHYSNPRVTGMVLADYTSIELALNGPEPGFLRPSELGIDGFDHLWESGRCPVAGFVPQADVQRLRIALRERAAKMAKEPNP